MTFSVSPFSTFGKALSPIFAGYLPLVGVFVDKVSGSDKWNCRIAETARKVGAAFGKYPAKQGVNPLPKPVVGEERKETKKWPST